MNGEHFMNGLELMPAGLRALKTVPAVALTLVLITAVVACSRLPLESPNGTVTGSGRGTLVRGRRRSNSDLTTA